METQLHIWVQEQLCALQVYFPIIQIPKWIFFKFFVDIWILISGHIKRKWILIHTSTVSCSSYDVFIICIRFSSSDLHQYALLSIFLISQPLVMPFPVRTFFIVPTLLWTLSPSCCSKGSKQFFYWILNYKVGQVKPFLNEYTNFYFCRSKDLRLHMYLVRPHPHMNTERKSFFIQKMISLLSPE